MGIEFILSKDASGSADSNRLKLPLATTPENITTGVKRFCANISRHDPVYIDYVETGFRPGWCHFNIAMMVELHGGSYLPGWIIWESSMLIEAEHHAVWHRLDNTLADVTPKVDGEQRILFLPDPGRPYNFRANLGWQNKRQLALPIPKVMKKMMMADARADVVLNLNDVNAYLEANGLPPIENVAAIRAPAISRGIQNKSHSGKK